MYCSVLKNKCNILHYQLLSIIILKFHLPVLIAQLGVYAQLHWAITSPYRPSRAVSILAPIRPVELGIRENIAPDARAIRRINSSNIALPGRTWVTIVVLLKFSTPCLLYLCAAEAYLS